METALLVIDMQAGNFTYDPPIHNGAELLEKVCALLAKARAAGAPVVFIQNDGPRDGIDAPGTPGWQLHPALNAQPTEAVVRKPTPDSFHATPLQEILTGLGVEQLVVCGLQTEYCVDTTVRRAFSLGYEVTLAADAHSTWDGEVLPAGQIIAHHNSVLGGWFAKIAGVEEITYSR
jgi:nicotinamidase-related amidase